MKQIVKTDAVKAMLSAAYGPDANTEPLAVFETVLANTAPLRKTGGLFKGARISMQLLADMATSVNSESLPLQMQHDTETAPFGRVFAAQLMPGGNELRGMFAADGSVHPDIVLKLDNGTIDQVSVGMVNTSMTCSLCGFDFLGADAEDARWTLTCDEGHVIGENDCYCNINGLGAFLETSLVGKGAVNGARIVGPSEAVMTNNPQYQQLAAAAGGREVRAFQITATLEDQPVDTAAFTAQLTAVVTEKATVVAELAAKTTAHDGLVVQLAAANAATEAGKVELAAAHTARDLATAAETVAKAALTTAEAVAAKAITALKAEATTILTACGKSDLIAGLKDDADALLATIGEWRGKFAAIIPVNGAALSADHVAAKPVTTTSAFRTAK